MADVNPAGWRKALEAYDYEVDFSGFPHIGDCKGPPRTKFRSRVETQEFESYFRGKGRSELCPWLEVIYWKMFSQPQGRPMRQVERARQRWESQKVSPNDLWTACKAYTEGPGKEAFDAFLKLFGYRSWPRPLAIAGTFPAFIQPDDFPMIDRRVAKWVIEFGAEHNLADPSCPQLRQPEAFARANKKGRSVVLTMADFHFMPAWTAWCRYTARKLSELCQPSVKCRAWRARDVEMAVFRAWGSRHPVDSIRLEPLPAVSGSDHGGC